jgi:tetratricopeptide (TPR) repeat protein
VGKTALALHWAHAQAVGFADGQLFVNLRGYDPAGLPVTAEEAIRGFLDALGVQAEQVPAGADAQAGLYRSLLAGRRMLIVLDNAADPGQVRPLLPASAGCLVIVTSRSSLAGLAATDGAALVALGLLPETEAEQLLAARLGPARLAAEPAAVGQIITLCARLPLALAIAAARAASVPGLALSALAAELAGEPAASGLGAATPAAGPDLDALDTADAATSIRAVFSWSTRALSETARRCFWLLGVHPGPDITWPATVSLTSLDPRAARRALAELVTASLLTEQQPGRWAFHDLLRAYAAEQAVAADQDGVLSESALTRAVDHYLHTAYGAALALEPTRTPIPEPLAVAADGVRPEPVSSRAQAQAWFRAEYQVLIQLLSRAAAIGHHTHAWQLQWCLDGFLEMEGHWQDTELANRIALDAATALGDHTVIAHAHQSMGRAAYLLENLDEAVEHHRQALAHAIQAGDLTRQALAHHGLSLLADELGDGDQALHHGEQAVELASATGDRVGEAYYLSKVGLFSVMLGLHDQGIAQCQRAVDLQRELGDAADIGFAQANLGRAYRAVGRYPEAIASLRECIALEQEVGNHLAAAFNLRCLGEVHVAAGQPANAVAALQQALEIYQQLPGFAEADELCAEIGQIEAEIAASPVSESA